MQENEAHLAQARVTLGRMTQLLKDGIVTQADVDQARLDVDATAARIASLAQQITVAERQVALQKTALDDTIIRAPFSGMAITKDAQPGEMVSPVSAGGGFTRTGICTVVDMHSLEIDVDVNESYINRVRPGQQVSAVLDAYPEWQIPGHVITTIPTADRQKATVQVRIAFEKLDPAYPAGHGHQGHLPPGGRSGPGRHGHAGGAADDARAEGLGRDRQCRQLRFHRSRRRRRATGGQDRRQPTATAWKCSPACSRASAWSSPRRRS